MDALATFSAETRAYFRATFGEPTRAQALGWPAIARGESTLILAPTGSGKTLAAFLSAIDRLLPASVSAPVSVPAPASLSVLYISPLKALAVDVERNLRAPLAGRSASASAITHAAFARATRPPPSARACAKHPPDILITTPESLYLLLTSDARKILAHVETVIVDEIHQLVDNKRGAHLFVSLERLEAIRPEGTKPLQRIGLSATQSPLDEIARLLGGFDEGTPRDGHDRRRGRAEEARAPSRRARRRHVGALCVARRATRRRAGSHDALDMAAPPCAPRGARSRASVDDDLREQPPARRAPRDRAERARRGRDRARAPRVRRAREARHHRRSPEARGSAGDRRDVVARARHRHGRGRSGDPSRGAAIDRVGHAARRAREPPRRRRSARRAHAEASRGSPRVRGRVERDADRRVEETFYPRNPLDVLAQQIVAIVAVEKDVIEVDARLRSRAPRGAVRGASAKRVRRRARHALGSLSIRRVRRAPPAHHVGSP